METSIDDRPVVRDYFIRSARIPYARAVCMLVAAVAVASSAIVVDPMHVRYYATAAGQHRTINCSNSSITLEAQSRIAIQCTRSLLRVRLLHGEASFRTAPDPSKSALVLAGDAQVYDFGSTFSVRQSADRTTVTVVEGFVELSVVDSGQRGLAARDGGGGTTQHPRRTVDQKPVWAGERATVMNAGAELESGSRRIVYSPAATGVIG
jgi:ferric-dicitrate binding protein FerR (iron transport regulator)